MIEGDGNAAEVAVGETSIFVRSRGTGPPLLLLHGFPQTRVMWRGVAPLLARRFTVVCADPLTRFFGPAAGVRTGGEGEV